LAEEKELLGGCHMDILIWHIARQLQHDVPVSPLDAASA